MPVHPKEEETHGDLTDKVAKESSDSTASSHEMHQADDDSRKPTVQDYKALPGPAIAENLGQPASKEDLKKRMEELNKK